MEKRETLKDKLKSGAKEVLALFDSKEEKVESKFKEEMLDDNATVISYDGDMLADGILVSVVDTNGSLLPMPVGKYATADGTTFEILDENGTAGNVLAAEEETTEDVEQEATAPVSKEAEQAVKRTVETVTKETEFKAEDVVEVKSEDEEVAADEDITEAPTMESVSTEEFAAVKIELAEQKEAFAKVEELANKVAEQETLIVALKALVEMIADEPSEAPTEAKVAKPFRAAEFKAARQAFREDLNK